jgi:hypothetical protein
MLSLILVVVCVDPPKIDQVAVGRVQNPIEYRVGLVDFFYFDKKQQI